ncbi:MAG: FMN-binding protein [Acidimicrobiales bacterium]
MRRVILAGVTTVIGLILLLSFKTHPGPTTLATPPAAISPSTTSTGSTAGSTSRSARPSATTATTPVSGAPASGATKTVTGVAVRTRYGPVQVEVTVANGRVTAVDAIVYPTQSSRDRQINARAIPQLDNEVLAAQNARIDTVSGATYTSTGFVTSLQSALAQAGLA